MSDQRTNLDGKLLVAKNDKWKATIRDLEAVLSTPEGKRFVFWLVEQCHVYGAIFTGEGAATDFRLGERNIGMLLITAMDDIAPTTYPQLLLEGARLAEKDKGKNDVSIVDE